MHKWHCFGLHTSRRQFTFALAAPRVAAVTVISPAAAGHQAGAAFTHMLPPRTFDAISRAYLIAFMQLAAPMQCFAVCAAEASCR